MLYGSSERKSFVISVIKFMISLNSVEEINNQQSVPELLDEPISEEPQAIKEGLGGNLKAQLPLVSEDEATEEEEPSPLAVWSGEQSKGILWGSLLERIHVLPNGNIEVSFIQEKQ